MKLYLASNNRHKAAEFQALAGASSVRGPGRIEILPAEALGGMPPVAEDTGSFAGNARKKAHALKTKLPAGGWALADDSGLCVDALGGAPGVESAHFAGPQESDTANLGKLVESLAATPDGKRGADYVCILVLLGPNGEEWRFEERCDGRLLREPRGSGGFGYDPLFVPDGYDRTFAELAREVKNRISHRGKAWAALAAWANQRR